MEQIYLAFADSFDWIEERYGQAAAWVAAILFLGGTCAAFWITLLWITGGGS
jgi:hypothetical protein